MKTTTTETPKTYTLPKANLAPPQRSGKSYDSVESMVRGVLPAKRAERLLSLMEKQRRVKARRMWLRLDEGLIGMDRMYLSRHKTNLPVAVLDISDPEALVEQVARSLCASDGLAWDDQRDPMKSGSGADDEAGYLNAARAVLQSLGILPAKKGRKSP